MNKRFDATVNGHATWNRVEVTCSVSEQHHLEDEMTTTRRTNSLIGWGFDNATVKRPAARSAGDRWELQSYIAGWWRRTSIVSGHPWMSKERLQWRSVTRSNR